MVVKYGLARAFRDVQTRLFIPNLQITVADALTNLVSSYVTAPFSSRNSFFFNREAEVNFQDKGLISAVSNLIDAVTIGLGVTKIEATQEYTMPLSKGIGSTGEVIHLLGAKNELINIEFKTDNYPGRLGYVLKSILQKILETTQVVYLIDDLFLATPCLIRKSKLSKEGNYRGAVMGEIELISLTTGGNWIKDKLGDKSKITSRASKLKQSVNFSALSKIGKRRLAIGVFSLSAILLSAIANGSG